MPDDQLTSLLDAQILDRIRAIGLPNLPSGTGVVPQVTSFKVMQVTPRPASVEVVLTWIDPISVANPVDHYIISVTGAVGNNRQPAAPYVVSKSPAKLSINLTPGLTGLTFQIQTVLKNGYVSPVETAPTCAAQVTPGNQENGVPSEVTLSTLTVTAAPTTLDTYVIPANIAKQGSIFRYTATGVYLMAAALNPILDITTSVNGVDTTSARVTYPGTPAGPIAAPWRFWYEICFRSIGSSGIGAVVCSVAAPYASSSGTIAAGTVSLDTTVPNTIAVRVSQLVNFTNFERYISYQEIFKDARF